MFQTRAAFGLRPGAGCYVASACSVDSDCVIESLVGTGGGEGIVLDRTTTISLYVSVFIKDVTFCHCCCRFSLC